MIGRPVLAAIGLLGASWAGAAWAGCADPNACICSVSVTNLAFGNYNPVSPVPNDAVATLGMTCISTDPGNSTFTIALSPGNTGNSNARTMHSGSHPLYYNLYTNAARTIVWGDGGGGGQTVTSGFPAVSHGTKLISIYGRIFALQNVWAGAYSDTVTVTVTY
ncbi:MAG TPA: spore coat U domain-containing protein [Sphingomonas sp.]|nr:spore coat U domain-containing protein [Sphingomonas sp.]